MTSKLLRAAVGSLIAMAVVSPSIALAESRLTIEAPRDGSLTNDSTPKFKGTTDYTLEEFEELLGGYLSAPVELEISNGGGFVQSPTTASSNGVDWSAVAEPLGDGTYTAKATQTNALMGTDTSNQVGFTVDATPPVLTITTPSNGSSSSGESQLVGGSAGTANGDLPAITVQLFAGEAIGPQPLETLAVQATNDSWSATLGGLGPGTYTAHATQRDHAGNVGSSGPVTFAITAPSAPPPPVASFTWFPPAPATGETVSLVSSSIDPVSPITEFAWSLSASGEFAPGNPLLTTSFATPGGHVVRLRVADADGRSSIATQTVPVSARARVLMQPFPIVRIAGSVTAGGARVTLLTVQAPIAARVTVTCRGHGCATKSESRVATISSKSKSKSNSRAGAVLLSFHRFERSLRAGVVLKILVTKQEQIGKYTRFLIRRHKLPLRTDACVGSTSPKPIPCSTS